MTDLTQLEALARAATQGPWQASIRPNRYWGVVIMHDACILDHANECDAAYIAAANPAAILALIERVRVAEAEAGEWKTLRQGYER